MTPMPTAVSSRAPTVLDVERVRQGSAGKEQQNADAQRYHFQRRHGTTV